MLTKANGHSKSHGTSGANMGASFLKAPISAFGEELRKPTKEDSLTIKLWSNPTDEKSGSFEVTITKLDGTETAWQLIYWQKQLEQIFEGQAITGGYDQVQMARRCIVGQPLTVFDRLIAELTTGATPPIEATATTPAMVATALKGLRTWLMPKYAQRQEGYYTRHLRKPLDRTMREYDAALHNLNTLIPQLPPYDESKKLSDADLVDVEYWGIPNSWKREMILQDFDPFAHDNTRALVEFCERIELTQSLDRARGHDNNTSTKRRKINNHQNGKVSTNGEKLHCALHGDNTTHTTAQCRTLKKLKADKAARDADSKPKFQNKTWSRQPTSEAKKSSPGTGFTRKDLQVLMALARSQDGDKKPAAKKKGSKRSHAAAVAQKQDSDEESVHVLEIDELLSGQDEAFQRLGIDDDDTDSEFELDV